MLTSLGSDLPGFISARFAPGLNVALARPGAGKSSLVRLLDGVLGADVRTGHPLRRPELTESLFTLTLDLFGRESTVTRGPANLLTPEIDGFPMRLVKLRTHLGAGLFGLTGGGTEPSFRSVMAYYVRDYTAGGLLSPTQTYRKQRTLDTQPALAYLFALDVDLVAKVREVTETDRNLRELRRAAKDSVLGLTLGRGRDLDAEIRTCQIQRDTLAAQLQNFQVAESYTRYRERIDELSRDIRQANDRLALAERRMKDIDAALADDEPPDEDYIRVAFDEVGAVLPDLVARRFAEVTAFHRSVVANRQRYLETERTRLLRDSVAEKEKLSRLDQERSELMRLLQAEGALETYAEIQRQISVLDGRLSELIERRAVVDRWSSASRQIQLRSAELEVQVSADLNDRREQLATISRTYARYAYHLYGDQRPAALTIEARRSGYKFAPTIGGPAAQEARAMTLFCFDLCLAVTARRAGHGPDFLVHDSHLFDEVPIQRVSRALDLAAEVCREEGVQYVAALDADRFEQVLAENSDLPYHVCTDIPATGLFGTD